MANDNEVFFIESSASDDDDNDHDTHDGEVERPVYRPFSASSSPTMEDILFGLAPPKRTFAAPPLSAASIHDGPPLHGVSGDVTNDNNNTNSNKCTCSRWELDGSVACSSPRIDVSTNAQQRMQQPPISPAPADFPYAGGSPCAMPTKQTLPPPRSLAELRAMTSSDVRDELERFFVRKDTFAKRFKALERDLLAPVPAVDASAKGDGSPQPPPSSGPRSFPSPSPATALARDRCRRLVNVSNWENAVGGYSQWDILLPSALLPDPAALPSPSTSATTTTTTTAAAAAQPRRRTLRPHQIEGIRFLWSILAEGPVGQVPAVGCILAHTMGLGKTGQVVVFLHLFMAAFQRRIDISNGGSGGVSGCSSARASLPRVLIVIPKSTQSCWKREFHTWSLCFPEEHRICTLSVEEGLRTHQRLEIFRGWRRAGGVLLIGYEALVRLVQLVEEDSVLAQQQRQELHPLHASPALSSPSATSRAQREQAAREQHRRDLHERRTDEGGKAFGGDTDPFTELVVCDEAHRLKSVHLHVVQALRGLHPLRRMLLTGTPLQNHLHEYWAMMDFCVHKYFSRRRFREYFIQPIELSANTRASEKEVDVARKKTFILINEVRHFVQRVDSTPLRNELPPLHEYVVVLPPSELQKALYLRFIQIVRHDGSQKLQFLPAVSYSGKIAAHPQLLFQMRDQLAEANGSGVTAGKKRVRDYWALEKANRQQQRRLPARPPPVPQWRLSDDGEDDGDAEAVVISNSDNSSSADSSGNRSVTAKAAQEDEFARVTQQSFSSLCPTPLTYEELCIPPSPAYVPRLEEGVKLYAAMKLIAAAMAQNEKVLLFSLSTQLLTFFEFMVAKVNVEWCKKPSVPAAATAAAADTASSTPLLHRPIRYCRLDGSHTAAQRAAMLDDFDRADGPDLFLLSMKAGGVGVTITAATRVILVDTSFNPADDQQAIGRAYRYGQTRPVFVYRMMCYPTLEYSIFVQKLAKEWLFKTVVEESSVKRDGLSGMHLKELFSLLTRAAKVLEKSPAATCAQVATTADVLRDDPLLGVVRDDLLYAQRYEMFLEQDSNDQYGAAEEEFYKDYCRNRLFDTADDDGDAEQQRAAALQQRRQQRMDEAVQLQAQSKTLTSMVDDLIRSRAGTDPHLARLLSAMGLRVDAASGEVHTTRRPASAPASSFSSLTSAPSEHFAPSPVVLLGGEVQPKAAQQSLMRYPPMASSGGEAPPSRSPHAHSSRQTAVLLLDSDGEIEEESEANTTADRERPQQQQQRDVRTVSTADRIGASLSRQPYARYRPGGSPSRAVEIDSDASQ